MRVASRGLVEGAVRGIQEYVLYLPKSADLSYPTLTFCPQAGPPARRKRVAVTVTPSHIPRFLIYLLPTSETNPFQIQPVALKPATRIFTGPVPVVSEK